jgi:hypothetical protein
MGCCPPFSRLCPYSKGATAAAVSRCWFFWRGVINYQPSRAHTLEFEVGMQQQKLRRELHDVQRMFEREAAEYRLSHVQSIR